MTTNHFCKNNLFLFLIWFFLLCTFVPPANAQVIQGDLNSDGVIDVVDLGILLGNWDKTVSTGLVLHYTMDAISGGIVADAAGSHNAGVFGDPAVVTGRIGNAIYFDGAGDYLDTGYTGDYPEWTIAVWARGDAAPAAGPNSGPASPLVGSGSNLGVNYNQLIDPNKTNFNSYPPNVNTVTQPGSWTVGAYAHGNGAVDKPPQVTVISVSPVSLTEGGAITASFTVTDDIALTQVELWRTADLVGSPDPDGWIRVRTRTISGVSNSGTFTDTPSAGTWYYGLHVVDSAGHTADEGSHGPDMVSVTPATAGGVLRIHPGNTRYLTDDSGRAIYISGSHTWLNIHTGAEMGITHNDAATFSQFLDFMELHGQNFTRLWTGYSYLTRPPFVWRRTGPGNANDGGLKFDLNHFDQNYFNILKERLTQLENRGLYASVMVFGSHNGFDCNFANIIWHPDNNVSNLGLNPSNGNSFYNLNNQPLKNAQQVVIRKFIDELNGFNNIIFEIMNEARFSEAWQKEMVNYAKSYENTKPKQHLWGITAGSVNTPLLAGAHDWWSPGDENMDGYNYTKDGGPAAYDDKIVIVDSDHYDGGLYYPTEPSISSGISMAWRTFTRGNPFIFMECYTAMHPNDPTYGCNSVGINHVFDPIRNALGSLVAYSKRFYDLAAMQPSETLASTGYVLANPARDYLVYQPGSGAFTVNLAAGTYPYEWLNSGTNQVVNSGSVTVNSGTRSFTPPFSGQAVLYLWHH